MELSDRFWRGFDQHVAEIALITLILAVIVPVSWLVYLVALVPQGRIFVKVGDYRQSKNLLVDYLIINEATVVIAVLMTLLLR